ncbi:MAG TPA: transposase [bacterium]|nr:transposase [bacterium]
MGRKRRAQFPGAVYHLTARGNNRQDIYLDDHDRYAFMEMLAQAVERYDLKIHAFCLMTNHYHLFLRTREPNLARAMHWLNNRYTKRFLFRHERSGHLFQGRYQAVLIVDEAHWITLAHYIHLNPVRAGIVTDPASYNWSSFLDFTRPAARYPWLDHEWVLARYGHSPGQRRRRYREACLMHSEKGPDFWQGLIASIMLAADETKDKLSRKEKKRQIDPKNGFYKRASQPNPEAELKKIAAAFKIDQRDLLAKRRNYTPKMAAYYHLVRRCGMSFKDAGNMLNVSHAAAYKGLKIFEKMMAEDARINKLMGQLS